MNKASRPRIAIYAALIFAGGLATGVLTTPLLGRVFLRPLSPEEMSRHLLSMLEHRLSLTPEQLAQVKPIIDQGGEDMKAIWLDTSGRVAARVEEINRQIAPLLTVEQRVKLEKLAAEGRERMRNRMPVGPPPPPPR